MESAVHYPYAFDENHNLVFIKDVERDTRHLHSFTCPCCSHPMTPRQGQFNSWHFAHGEGRPCSSESYIHFTAKEIVARRFNDRKSPFNISLEVERRCSFSSVCKEIQNNCRLFPAAVEYDLHEHYDLPAVLEVDVVEPDGVTHYRPDVLLRSSNPLREDIFIEIYHNHKSTNNKVESGHRIIEIRIRDMEALRWLETTPSISETKDVQFYGFKRDLKVSPDTVFKIAKLRALESMSVNQEEFMEMENELLEGAASKQSVASLDLNFDYESHEEEYYYPACKQSPQIKKKVREAERYGFHLRRFTLYKSGKYFETGIYYDELDAHHPSAVMDITYDTSSSWFDPLKLLAQKDYRARLCSLCDHCIRAGYEVETIWCDIRKNGSSKKGTFDILRGRDCVYFEWRHSFLPESNEKFVEGIDYTIWINPNLRTA